MNQSSNKHIWQSTFPIFQWYIWQTNHRGTTDHPSKQRRQVRKSLPISASKQHVKNVGMMLQRDECGIWLLLYCKRKLKPQRERTENWTVWRTPVVLLSRTWSLTHLWMSSRYYLCWPHLETLLENLGILFAKVWSGGYSNPTSAHNRSSILPANHSKLSLTNWTYSSNYITIRLQWITIRGWLCNTKYLL